MNPPVPVSEYAVLIGLVGLCVGSFINVVIHRLPLTMADMDPSPGMHTIIAGRSRCPHCRQVIRWRDNIPLIGWLRRLGRCRDCQAPISLRYPIIEALMGIGGLLVIARFGLTPAGLSAFLLTAWLLALAGIDQTTRLLPDRLTLSGLWLGLLVAAGGIHLEAREAILGVVAGYISLSGLNAGFRLLRGQDGMGGGDFKLMAMLGAWLGPGSLPLVMLFAAGGGTLWSLLAGPGRGHPLPEQIPFGPWLALAGWITLVWPYDRGVF
ncbi:A24 family peptidase [Spiribacter sp. 221]|uniref:prepilin peptidase n=1 Tax=Spiribacter onubensis TaxID=3122420 RepID=UPI00349F6139